MTDDLGIVVATRRTALGLRRKDLAERARLSYPYISEIENGVKEPSAKAMRQIADALDLTVAELASLTERIDLAPASPNLLVEAAGRPTGVSFAPATMPTRRVLDAPPAGSSADELDERLRAHVDRRVQLEVDRWLDAHLPGLLHAALDARLRAPEAQER